MRPPTSATGRPASHVVIRLALGVLLLAGGASCDRETRPSVDEWTARWDAARELIPPRAGLPDAPTGEFCEDVLVDLREAGPELTPSPDEVVDQAVTSWLRAAESTFFECFDSDVGARPVAEAYDELDQLEDEVTAALAGSSSAGGPTVP